MVFCPKKIKPEFEKRHLAGIKSLSSFWKQPWNNPETFLENRVAMGNTPGKVIFTEKNGLDLHLSP